MTMGSEEFIDSPLHEAVRYGDLSEVRDALTAGHDPNLPGAYQWTSLQEAANTGDVAVTRLLLQHQGNPNQQDALHGYSAVHYAASQGHTDCLKELLKAGGQTDLLTKDGQTCLDIATGDCCDTLLHYQRELQNASQKHHVTSDPVSAEDQLADRPDTPETLDVPDESAVTMAPQLDSPTSMGTCDLTTRSSSIHDTSVDEVVSLDASSQPTSLQDLDNISIATSSSSGYGSPRVNRSMNILGYLDVSFEYNAKRRTVNIRVWRLLQLLLPPAETSMIKSIYVKSYLLLDKKKTTKRKTEEICVDDIGKSSSTTQDKNSRHTSSNKSYSTSIQHVFQPSNFVFTKSLEYSGISADMVHSRQVLIEVCLTQKYTRRSFPVATWTSTLAESVRMIRRQKRALVSRLSTSLPENMKLYSPSLIEVVHNDRRMGSLRSLQSVNSDSWAVPYNQQAHSDTDLHRVVVQRNARVPPTIEVTIPDEDDSELTDALQQIAIMEAREISQSEKPDTSRSLVCERSCSDPGGRPNVAIKKHSNINRIEKCRPTAIESKPAQSSVHTIMTYDNDEDCSKAHRILGIDEVQIHMAPTDEVFTEDKSIKKKRNSLLSRFTKNAKAKKQEGASTKHLEADAVSKAPSDALSWDDYGNSMHDDIVAVDFEDDHLEQVHNDMMRDIDFELPPASLSTQVSLSASDIAAVHDGLTDGTSVSSSISVHYENETSLPGTPVRSAPITPDVDESVKERFSHTSTPIRANTQQTVSTEESCVDIEPYTLKVTSPVKGANRLVFDV